jgi:hypothetical protein
MLDALEPKGACPVLVAPSATACRRAKIVARLKRFKHQVQQIFVGSNGASWFRPHPSHIGSALVSTKWPAQKETIEGRSGPGRGGRTESWAHLTSVLLSQRSEYLFMGYRRRG